MLSGEVIADRFVIEKAVGRGGMGTVYRATDRIDGAIVAVKVMRGTDAREAERFSRESLVLATLRHPAIVRYVAHGLTASGEPYLAMEWLEGEDLHDRLVTRGVTIDESVRIVRRAAEALVVAHARGVIHRDIKPSNLFLVPLGDRGEKRDGFEVKLLDFGVARLTHATRSATRTGAVLGTPGYMAPEQARGEAGIDARADVFSLGCCLYECLTGKPAFAGENVMAVLAKILLEEAPRARAVRPDVPEALDEVLATMLAKDRSKRLADAAAVIDALERVPTATADERRPKSTGNEALTQSEQRLLSVVLAASETESADLVAAAPTMVSRPDARDTVSELVARNGGRLDRLFDGSMVVTLVDLGVATDQATRAARCALALRRALPTVPIAVATGRGEVAGRLPVGAVIDRAASILRAARKAAPADDDTMRNVPIHIDDVTVGLLDGRFDVRGDATGLILHSERDAIDTTRRLLGKTTSCVGRETDLALLEAAVHEATEESAARVVIVTAPAGAGKSRVRHELLSRARERFAEVDVWLVRGDPMSAGSAFAVIASLVRRIAGVLDGEDDAVQRKKLRARVARHIPADALQRVTEFLGELAGIPFPDAQSVQLQSARRDALLMGDQMRRAWEDFVDAESSANPVLLVVEDLHWGDLPSVKFIDAALRHAVDRAFVVVAFARPEVHDLFPHLWNDRGASEVRLRPLSRKASEKLVREVLGADAETALVDRIVDRAAGNALYLEELVRAAKDGTSGDLPESVLAMVQSRLERLEPEARRTLRAGSVFGASFWRGGVVELLGGAATHTKVTRAFGDLVDDEVISSRGEGRFPGEPEYTFRHALVREAAYAMLTEHDRALGHRLAGEWLARHGERDALVLAEHFERGGDRAKAASQYVEAAAQALEGNDYDGAMQRAQRAEDCGASHEKLGEARVIAAEARRWRGRMTEADEAARSAMSLLPRASALWYKAVAEHASASGPLGRIEALLELPALLRDPTLGAVTAPRVIAAAHVVVQLNHLGRYAEAQGLLVDMRRFRELAASDPAVTAWVERAATMRAASSVEPGALYSACRTSVGAFESAGDLRMACFQRMNLGYANIVVGRYDDACTVLAEAEAIARRLGLLHLVSAIRSYEGFAIGAGRSPAEGIAMLDTVVGSMRAAGGDPRMLARALISLARLHSRSGNHDAAEASARGAIGAAEKVPMTRSLAEVVLAHVQLRRGNIADAMEGTQRGMAVLAKHGSVEDGEALLRWTHAEALHASGDGGAARDAIARARDAVLDRASRIDDAAAKASYLESVEENARTLARAAEWS